MVATVGAFAEETALDHKLKTIDGEEKNLADYKGKVVVVVNVASKCGATPQYKDLQALYTKYEKEGLVVIGVPCNQFGGQEPGTEADIKEFCSSKYSVTLPDVFEGRREWRQGRSALQVSDSSKGQRHNRPDQMEL